MYIKNDIFKRAYRLIFMCICTMGICLQYAIVSQIGKIQMLSCYYTILSNMVCFLYFGYLLIWNPKRKNPWIRGMVVLCISITCIVYHFMLNGSMESGVGAVKEVTTTELTANTILHYIVPIMTIFDYFLFAPKGEYKWYYPFIWLALPLIYLVFIMIRAEVSTGMFAGFSGFSRYPYPFIDVDIYGWGYVSIAILIMFVSVIALGYLSYGIDKLCQFIKNKIGINNNQNVNKQTNNKYLVDTKDIDNKKLKNIDNLEEKK